MRYVHVKSLRFLQNILTDWQVTDLLNCTGWRESELIGTKKLVYLSCHTKKYPKYCFITSTKGLYITILINKKKEANFHKSGLSLQANFAPIKLVTQIFGNHCVLYRLEKHGKSATKILRELWNTPYIISSVQHSITLATSHPLNYSYLSSNKNDKFTDLVLSL